MPQTATIVGCLSGSWLAERRFLENWSWLEASGTRDARTPDGDRLRHAGFHPLFRIDSKSTFRFVLFAFGKFEKMHVWFAHVPILALRCDGGALTWYGAGHEREKNLDPMHVSSAPLVVARQVILGQG